MGGVFDPEKRRFDHHQRSFTVQWWDDKEEKKAEEDKKEGDQKAAADGEEAKKEDEAKEKKEYPMIKMSSAGLVYKFYGKEVIKNMCQLNYNLTLNDA